MSESTGNNRKRYVDHLKDRSKLTCLVHGPRNTSYECKVLGEFGSKHSKVRPTRDHMKDSTTKNKFYIQQENYYIV